MSRADAIANPHWRDSFLNSVVENRAILDLASTWSDDDGQPRIHESGRRTGW